MGRSEREEWLASIEDVQSLLRDATFAYVNVDDEWVVEVLGTVEDRSSEFGDRENAFLVACCREESREDSEAQPSPPRSSRAGSRRLRRLGVHTRGGLGQGQ